MLRNIHIKNILFLDIETVPLFANYDEMPAKNKELWKKKAAYLKRTEEDTEKTLYQRAGIYAEFGKIVCISVGIVKDDELRIKSFFGDDEKDILINFAELLNKYYFTSNKLLCAHNGKEFDFPYIARRMLINGVHLPKTLDLAGKKPWEVSHIDTLELWKFGDYKNYTSLDLLTTIFDIPTPKDDIDGSMVCEVYWKEKNLKRIVKYCQQDVIAIVQLFRKYRLQNLIPDDRIIFL